MILCFLKNLFYGKKNFLIFIGFWMFFLLNEVDVLFLVGWCLLFLMMFVKKEFLGF